MLISLTLSYSLRYEFQIVRVCIARRAQRVKVIFIYVISLCVFLIKNTVRYWEYYCKISRHTKLNRCRHKQPLFRSAKSLQATVQKHVTQFPFVMIQILAFIWPMQHRHSQ